MREVLHRWYSSYGKFWITGLISGVKFSFLQWFLGFYYIPEILIFLCVVEFSKNVLAFFFKRDYIPINQLLRRKCYFGYLVRGTNPLQLNGNQAFRKESYQSTMSVSQFRFWRKSVNRNIIIVIWHVLFLIQASISLGCCNENICWQKRETLCLDMVFKFSPNLSNALFAVCSICLLFFLYELLHELYFFTWASAWQRFEKLMINVEILCTPKNSISS